MAKMDPLLREHAELRPRVDELLVAADLVGDAPITTLHEMVDDCYEFLASHLIPHAEAEDEVLYPAVEHAAGSPGAMATMSRDHVEVSRLTDELKLYRAHLATVTPGNLQTKRLRRVLYGLYAVVHLHFAKEEEILVPILESKMGQAEADRMFLSMEQVAERARSRAMELAHPGSRLLHA